MAQIIDRETMPQFLRLIPSELKFKICLPGTVVIGETAEGPDGVEPAGVLVLTMRQPEEITVEWLWVEDELRGEGVGESLLMVAFDMAKADYRLLIGRYLFLITFGCWFYLHPDLRLSYESLIGMFVIGANLCESVDKNIGENYEINKSFDGGFGLSLGYGLCFMLKG